MKFEFRMEHNYGKSSTLVEEFGFEELGVTSKQWLGLTQIEQRKLLDIYCFNTFSRLREGGQHHDWTKFGVIPMV